MGQASSGTRGLSLRLHARIAQMSSELAQRIRDARAARELSLDEAERVTKIKRRYLEAIEAGDFAQLPDGPPGRGFVKNYARYLGLDPEGVVDDFEAEVGVPMLRLKDPAPPPPVRHKPVSRLTQMALPEGNGGANGRKDNGRSSPQAIVPQQGNPTGQAVASDNRGLRASGSSFRLKNVRGPFEEYDPNMLTARGQKKIFSVMPRPSIFERYLPYALGAVVSVGALAFLLFFVLPRAGEWISSVLPPQPQATTTVDQPEFVPEVTIFAPQAQPVQPVTQQTDQTGQAQPAEQTPIAPTVIGTAAPATDVQAAPGGGLQLALDARERAWVRVKVDGNVVFEGIAPIGPGAPFSAKQDVQVETGNAGAFDIILNNTRLGPLGARNETVTKTWNAGGQ